MKTGGRHAVTITAKSSQPQRPRRAARSQAMTPASSTSHAVYPIKMVCAGTSLWAAQRLMAASAVAE